MENLVFFILGVVVTYGAKFVKAHFDQKNNLFVVREQLGEELAQNINSAIACRDFFFGFAARHFVKEIHIGVSQDSFNCPIVKFSYQGKHQNQILRPFAKREYDMLTPNIQQLDKDKWRSIVDFYAKVDDLENKKNSALKSIKSGLGINATFPAFAEAHAAFVRFEECYATPMNETYRLLMKKDHAGIHEPPKSEDFRVALGLPKIAM